MERILQSIGSLDESRRKRVRQALESGDRKTARQELTEAGIASDEDIEAYLQHLEEEQKRLQSRLLKEVQLRENQDEEELLLLAMDAMKLEDKDSTPCPRCSKANVSLVERGTIECPNCELSIRWQGTLEDFREYLAGSLVDHAKTNCQNTRPLVDASVPSKKLFMHCLDCEWTRLAPNI